MLPDSTSKLIELHRCTLVQSQRRILFKPRQRRAARLGRPPYSAAGRVYHWPAEIEKRPVLKAPCRLVNRLRAGRTMVLPARLLMDIASYMHFLGQITLRKSRSQKFLGQITLRKSRSQKFLKPLAQCRCAFELFFKICSATIERGRVPGVNCFYRLEYGRLETRASRLD
jgi:hypothetical protein